MSKTQEALKMAIEALESCDSAEGMSGKYQFYDEKLIDPAIKACKAALAAPETVTLPKIDYDADMDRYYIPMPAGWEMQTKGKGSSFRLCDTKTGERYHVTDTFLQQALEKMAREMHEASKQVSLPDGWVSVETELPSKPCFAYYKNELGNSRTVKAKYVKQFSEEAHTDDDWIEYNEADDTYYYPAGWYEMIDNWDDYAFVTINHQVTHWMPLPSAPTLNEKG